MKKKQFDSKKEILSSEKRSIRVAAVAQLAPEPSRSSTVEQCNTVLHSGSIPHQCNGSHDNERQHTTQKHNNAWQLAIQHSKTQQCVATHNNSKTWQCLSETILATMPNSVHLQQLCTKKRDIAGVYHKSAASLCRTQFPIDSPSSFLLLEIFTQTQHNSPFVCKLLSFILYF